MSTSQQMPTHLRIQNVQSGATTQDISMLLLQAGVHQGVRHIVIVGGIHGDVFVQFNEPTDMIKALELNGRTFIGQAVKCTLAKQCDVDWAVQESKTSLQRKVKMEGSNLMDSRKLPQNRPTGGSDVPKPSLPPVAPNIQDPTHLQRHPQRVSHGKTTPRDSPQLPPSARSSQSTGAGNIQVPNIPAKNVQVPKMQLPTHLHLKHLPCGVTDNHIIQFLSHVSLERLIDSIYIIKGVRRTAFITFKEPAVLLRALELDGQHLMGQPVKVSLAKLCDLEWAQHEASVDKPKDALTTEGYNQISHLLRLRYLSINPTVDDIKQFFAGAGLVKRGINVEVISHFHRDAFVRFTKYSELMKALALDGQYLLGKHVMLTTANDDDIDWAKWEAGSDDAHSSQKHDDTKDRDFHNKPCLLHIQNFPRNSNTGEVRNFLRKINLRDTRCVRKIQLVGDNGDVFITFREHADLQKALEFDGQSYCQQTVRVSICKQVDIDKTRLQVTTVVKAGDIIDNVGVTHLRLQNLSSRGTENDILGFFAKAGLGHVVSNIKVKGGICGEALVTIQEAAYLPRALELDGQLLLSQPVKMSLAKQVDLDLAGKELRTNTSHSAPNQVYQNRRDIKKGTSNLLLRNLCSKGTVIDVLKFFSQMDLDGHVSKVVISSSRDTIVTFREPTDLAKALKLDAEYLLGQRLMLSPAKENDIVAVQYEGNAASQYSLPCYVCLQSIPSKATMIDIIQFFSYASLERSVSKSYLVGNPNVEAFVSFTEPSYLLTAMRLSGRILLGHPVKLSLAKESDLSLAQQKAETARSSMPNRIQDASTSRQEPSLKTQSLPRQADIKPLKSILKKSTAYRSDQEINRERVSGVRSTIEGEVEKPMTVLESVNGNDPVSCQTKNMDEQQEITASDSGERKESTQGKSECPSHERKPYPSGISAETKPYSPKAEVVGEEGLINVTRKRKLQQLTPVAAPSSGGSDTSIENKDETSDVVKLETAKKILPGSYAVMYNVAKTVTEKDLINFLGGYPIHDNGIIIVKGTAAGNNTVYVRFVDDKHADMAYTSGSAFLHGHPVIINKISETLFEYQKAAALAKVNNKASTVVTGTKDVDVLDSSSSGSSKNAKRSKIQHEPPEDDNSKKTAQQSPNRNRDVPQGNSTMNDQKMSQGKSKHAPQVSKTSNIDTKQQLSTQKKDLAVYSCSPPGFTGDKDKNPRIKNVGASTSSVLGESAKKPKAQGPKLSYCKLNFRLKGDACPYMSLHVLPSVDTTKHCYLRLDFLPAGITACSVWEGFGGASGLALGVTLGASDTAVTAFALCSTIQNCYKAKERCKRRSVITNAKHVTAHFDNLALDNSSTIFVSTAAGLDRMLTHKERAEILKSLM